MGGYLFKSKTNDKAIFFPAVGWVYNGIQGLGEDGEYWLRTYSYDYWPHQAHILGFRNGDSLTSMLTAAYYARQYGANVRAVYVGQ